MADRVLQRHDTAARWQQYNPVLAEGEIGIITDGAKGYKIGDGKTPWNSLPFPANPANVVQETGDSESAVMSQRAVSENFVNKKDVVNDLTTGGTDKALSAEMGAELNDKISSIVSVYEHTESTDYIEADVDIHDRVYSAITTERVKKEYLPVEFEEDVRIKGEEVATINEIPTKWIDNDYYSEVEVDEEDKILEYRDEKGEKHVLTKVFFKEVNAEKALFAGAQVYETEDIDMVYVECDIDGRIIRYVTRDGTNHFPKLDFGKDKFTYIEPIFNATDVSNNKNLSLYLINADGNTLSVYSGDTFARIDIKRIRLNPNMRCYYYIKLNAISIEPEGAYAQFSSFFNWYKPNLNLGENIYFNKIDTTNEYEFNDFLQFVPKGSNRESRQIATVDVECFAFIEVDKSITLTQSQVEEIIASGGIYAANYSLTKLDKGNILSSRKWVLLGDSITAQGKYIKPTQNELNIGQTLNLGVGGKTLSDNGYSGMCYDEYMAQIPDDAYLITVMGGTNDFSQNIPLGEYISTNKNEYCGAVNYMIDYITNKYPESRLVMVAPPLGVNWGYFPDSEGVLNNIGLSTIDYANACEGVCKKRGIPCVNMSSMLGWTPKNISSYVINDGGDGYNAAYYHPTQVGGNRMAAVLAGYLRTILPLSSDDI